MLTCLRLSSCLPEVRGAAALLGVVLCSCVAAATPARAAIVADSADDVCAASADPCVIAQEVDVVAGSDLDFGLRTLRIEGAGVLDVPNAGASLACGRFEAATSAPAVRVRGGDSPAAAPGTVFLRVRRGCSLAAQTPCLLDSDCAAVSGGTCRSGSGAAIVGAPIHAGAELPARVVVRAAGDVSLLAPVAVAGTRTASDGGSFELESTGGSVLVAAPVDVSGGAGGGGGDFWVMAAGDIAIRDRIDANGGEYDGGSIALEAGRDVTITEDMHADSLSGAGAGGEIEVTAGANIAIAGGTASNALVLTTDGHQSADNYGGDGGSQAFEADGNLTVSRYVRFGASAAPPDGFADSLSFAAGGDLEFDGSVVARGRGTGGGGGLVDLAADGDLRASTTASFDLTGAAVGGDLMIETDGALQLAASVDVSASASGFGGRVVAVARGDADVSGDWTTAGADSSLSVGELFLEGCRVRVSAALANSAAAGRNRIVAHDSATITAAGSLRASGSGAVNSIRYRRSSQPPVLDGLVLPSASLVVDAELIDCPVCGNAEVNVGESCDDGNVDGGDGCSPRCQIESCEAATPGYPDTPLCSDANECTADLCDVAGTCSHAPLDGDCDDGDFCSAGGSCIDGTCVPSTPPSLSAASLKIRLGRAGGGSRRGDRATWKGEFPASLLAASPSDSRVRMVLLDPASRPILDASLPGGSFRGEDASWRYRAADPAAAGIVKASIEAAGQGDLVRVRFKLRGADLAETASAGSLSLALLVGDEPESSLCSSSGEMSCERGRGKVSCESAP